MKQPTPEADILQGQQIEICTRYGVMLCETALADTAGVSLNVSSIKMPINGLRHPISDGTSGWYIYAGAAFEQEPDFFKPLHVQHLFEWRPTVLKYLGLPPGWRFLVGENGYEDVWFDSALLG